MCPRPLTLRFLTGLAHALKTRSLAQKSTCKDLRRNGQDRAITPKAAYTPVPNRASSRSAPYSRIRLHSMVE
ncbi:alpha-galactosidase [Lacticaseibacillus chiayiensis]|uniref:Alpha-galactosidase n=1 Tax=Lacticaseibacillus chiayiensis TaxID=2100821 RepID=A0A4V1P2E5_9LACO|nr:alpha-galactosidase [Lacticaseibacillus chiayiensis]